jgi:hypothetical protein
MTRKTTTTDNNGYFTFFLPRIGERLRVLDAGRYDSMVEQMAVAGEASVRKRLPKRTVFTGHSGPTSIYPFETTFAVNDCTMILPSRTTNVSVPSSYTLSAVSALQTM